jgi:hypothetical protein
LDGVVGLALRRAARREGAMNGMRRVRGTDGGGGLRTFCKENDRVGEGAEGCEQEMRGMGFGMRRRGRRGRRRCVLGGGGGVRRRRQLHRVF